MRLVLIEFAIFQSPQNFCEPPHSAGHVSHTYGIVLLFLYPTHSTHGNGKVAFYCHTIRGLVSSSLSDRWLRPIFFSTLVNTYHSFTRQKEWVRQPWRQRKINCEHKFTALMQSTQVCSLFIRTLAQNIRKTRARFYISTKKKREEKRDDKKASNRLKAADV